MNRPFWIFGTGKIARDNLQHQHTQRENVQLLGVSGRSSECLGGHVDHRSGALGERCHSRVEFDQLRHAKVSHFCSTPGDEEDVVAGEISVDDSSGVEEGDGHGYVVADIDLNVVHDRRSHIDAAL